MYDVSAQDVDECMINVHYYYIRAIFASQGRYLTHFLDKHYFKMKLQAKSPASKMPESVPTLSLSVKVSDPSTQEDKKNAILIGQYKTCAHFSASICFKLQTDRKYTKKRR